MYYITILLYNYITKNTVILLSLIGITTEGEKLVLFLSFSYYNFEDTVTNFDKDIFREESFRGKNSNC